MLDSTKSLACQDFAEFRPLNSGWMHTLAGSGQSISNAFSFQSACFFVTLWLAAATNHIVKFHFVNLAAERLLPQLRGRGLFCPQLNQTGNQTTFDLDVGEGWGTGVFRDKIEESGVNSSNVAGQRSSGQRVSKFDAIFFTTTLTTKKFSMMESISLIKAKAANLTK